MYVASLVRIASGDILSSSLNLRAIRFPPQILSAIGTKVSYIGRFQACRAVQEHRGSARIECYSTRYGRPAQLPHVIVSGSLNALRDQPRPVAHDSTCAMSKPRLVTHAGRPCLLS